MTDMLEKAARAACVEMFGSDGLYATKDGVEKPMWPKCLPVARAVLMAVREPDGEVIKAGQLFHGFDEMPEMNFTAMIDAILAQEPGA